MFEPNFIKIQKYCNKYGVDRRSRDKYYVLALYHLKKGITGKFARIDGDLYIDENFDRRKEYEISQALDYYWDAFELFEKKYPGRSFNTRVANILKTTTNRASTYLYDRAFRNKDLRDQYVRAFKEIIKECSEQERV